MARIASILFPLPLPEPFDYAVPPGMTVEPGAHVVAPLGPNERRGVVWSVREGEVETDLLGEVDASKLKSLIGVLPAPPMREEARRLVDWSAAWLAQPPGLVLSLMLRPRDATDPPRLETVVTASGAPPGKLTPARARALETIAALGEASPAELAKAASVTGSVVKGLMEAGALCASERPADRIPPQPDPSRPGAALSPDQTRAADAVKARLLKGFEPMLLDGVTGSGKTEVYLEAIAELLARDPEAQALVLLPEIALTQAILKRFEERFGCPPVEWHSQMGHAYKRSMWRAAASGAARIVVGARSALYLPYARLRLIVIDEEHDGSFKQEEGGSYHARDMAVARAKFEGAAVLLASATPSLETMRNAQRGRYAHIRLPARHGAARPPEVQLVDLKTDPPQRGGGQEKWLSPILEEEIRANLERGEQTLLYLNRRGYAPAVLCRACGQPMKAPDTDSFLTEHRYTGMLICHLTGFSMPKPKACPACKAEGSLHAVGPGVERVADEARALVPGARIEVFSSDTVRGPAAVREMVERMASGAVDLLVGTQIVAKGHNFPGLTLVGVVDGDLGLMGGDLRAGEKTFQLLQQVAGRAGRADKPGRAFIQTHQPEHPAMQALAANDRDAFLEHELAERELLGLPPFGRLAAVILEGPTEEAVEKAGQGWAEAAPHADGVDVWGPAPPPYQVIRGRWRRRLLARADERVDLSAYMRAWLSRAPSGGGVRAHLDMDPYSFF